MIPDWKIKEAIRLRTEEGMSLNVIAVKVGISKASASKILKPYPWSEEERRASRKAHIRKNPNPKRRNRGEPSFIFTLKSDDATSGQVGAASEYAVMMRLALMGYEVYKGLHDGGLADMVVTNKKGKVIKLQVKTCCWGQHGRPSIALRTGRRKRQHDAEECDFMVGYDCYQDAVFVVPMEKALRCNHQYAVREEDREAWHLLE